jgi:hypothetical protein
MTSEYPPPLDQLLALGRPDPYSQWADYRALGLGDEHVPALLALIDDPRLSWDAWSEDDDDTPHWAPRHAWRALGQLGAAAAAEPLVNVLLRSEDDDGTSSDIPVALAMMGPAALRPVRDALPGAARRPQPWVAGDLGEALVKIAGAHPELREQVVETLTRQLRVWPNQGEEMNGFLVADLLDLRAVEAAPVMREAFEAGAVDESVAGDWEDVQVALGLLAQRTTPAPRLVLSPPFRDDDEGPRSAPRSGKAAEKARNRRKAEKQSRKKNRKRK